MPPPDAADERLYWHCLPENRRLRFPPRTLVEPGMTLRVDATAGRGMYGSRVLLFFLPCGPTICRIRMAGIRNVPTDVPEVQAAERRIEWVVDATHVLHEFACQCAQEVLAQEESPDPKLLAAVEAKRRWMRGEIGDEELQKARSEAEAAVDSLTASAIEGVSRHEPDSVTSLMQYAVMDSLRRSGMFDNTFNYPLTGGSLAAAFSAYQAAGPNAALAATGAAGFAAEWQASRSGRMYLQQFAAHQKALHVNEMVKQYSARLEQLVIDLARRSGFPDAA